MTGPARSPLSDEAIDPAVGAKKTAGVRPFLVVSIAESVLIGAAAYFILGCHEVMGLHGSPGEEGLFDWAPAPARFWLLNLSSALCLGVLHLGDPLILYFFASGLMFQTRMRSRFRLRLGFGGAPPLVGAVLFPAIGAFCMAPFILIGMNED